MNRESKAKHVPAPWRVEVTEDSNGYVNIKMGNYFAAFYGELCEEPGNPTDVAMATARLIAASPEMYDALRKVNNFISANMGKNYMVALLNREVPEIKELIKKIEG